MKVKVSVKKLHRIEQMYEQRIEENRRLYCREVDAMKKETEYYKESAKGEHEYYKDMVSEVLELKEQIKEANAENEKLRDDLKFEGKDNYTITPKQMRSIIQALKRMGENLADEYANGGEGRFASNYAISLADDLERDLAR